MKGLYRSDALDDLPHGFSGRDGLGQINCPLVKLRQVHSADAVIVGGAAKWNDAVPPQADALVTDQPGFFLAIVTADCAPILLADAAAGVVGAAHAGWRGAAGGVIENTVAAMCSLGATRSAITAAIGPCIAQVNYEVDAPFRDQFADEDAAYFAPGKPDHWHFDLPGFVLSRLAEAGVHRTQDLALDTYADPSAFHSYRRATHLGEASDGRQTSIIALR